MLRIRYRDAGKIYAQLLYNCECLSCRAKGRAFFMQFKALIMDEAAFGRAVTRISHEIVERNKGTENVVLLGVRRRGMPIARMIQQSIEAIEGVTVPCGELDIRYYRDDLTKQNPDPEVRPAPFPFDIVDKTVVIVDDVMYTGRTVRAATEAVFAEGRPRRIQLAILIDRGHRELPFKADYVGKNVPTSRNELISVSVPEYDGKLCAELFQLDG